jgi:phosphate transport system protein
MRATYCEQVREIERRALEGMDLVLRALDDAMQAVNGSDAMLVARVVADEDRLDAHCRDVNASILSLLALQAPVASDLRLMVALIDVLGRMERMGDQCVTIAKLVVGLDDPDDPDGPADAVLLESFASMGLLVREQTLMAERAFVARDVVGAERLRVHDLRINALNREIFRRGVEIGGAPQMRRWAMQMTLAARCLERIGDNAVDIGERAAFVATGLLREFADASHR